MDLVMAWIVNIDRETIQRDMVMIWILNIDRMMTGKDMIWTQTSNIGRGLLGTEMRVQVFRDISIDKENPWIDLELNMNTMITEKDDMVVTLVHTN